MFDFSKGILPIHLLCWLECGSFDKNWSVATLVDLVQYPVPTYMRELSTILVDAPVAASALCGSMEVVR